MRDFFLYNAARIGLLAVSVAVIWYFSGPSLLSTIVAVIVATLLSYLLLNGMKQKAVQSMTEWTAQRRNRGPKAGSDEAIEDEIDEQHR